MITIAGCGALGSLFAARLLEAGHSVQAYQRPGAQLQALSRTGLTIEADRDGATRHYRLHAVSDDPAALHASRLIIVLVKAYDTVTLHPLKRLLNEDGMVLTLQNGLGNAETLAEMFGPARVAAGVTTCGAFSLKPGTVCWGGDGDITLGPWTAQANADWIADLLGTAGLKAAVVADPRPAIWTKLAINAMLNTVTALTGMRNGATRDNPPALELMQGLGRETVAAAARAGVALEFEELWTMLMRNLERTAVNRTSMLQDVCAKRRTEVDFISGGVLRFARDDSEFPCTRTVHSLLSAIDRLHLTGSGE